MKKLLPQLSKWVHPPVFAEEEKTRRAVLLNAALWIGVAFIFLFGLLSLFSGPTRTLNLLYSVLYLVMVVIAFRLMHLGHVTVASLWVLGMLTGVITLGIFFSNGMSGIAISAQFIIVVLAALLVDGRTGAGFAILNIGINVLVAWLQLNERLPVGQFIETPIGRLVAHGVDLAVVAGLLALASYSILSALERVRANERRLQYMATHDTLTTLPNRAMFSEHLRHSLAQARRQERRFAVLFLDLDDFKPVNDVFGHAHGDEVLKAVVQRLRDGMRESDIIARIGGDEFVCIIEDLDQEQSAAMVAQRLLDALNPPFHLDRVDVFLSTSIGISIFPDDGNDPDLLVRQADAAMYSAKQSGKNQYQFFSRDMSIRSHERHLLSNQLRKALANNEFILWYQPVVHRPTGRVVAVEALLRWKRGEGAPIELPDVFVPVLEENGVILEVGNWVLAEAARQLKSWEERGIKLRMMVNVAGRQLRFSEFYEQVASVLQTNTITPGDLVLEFSEKIIFKEIKNISQAMERLKSLGVGLAVDDFGNGNLSLHQLIDYPFNMLKIDRVFTAGIGSDPRNAAILAGIISAARELNLDLVVEGVETEVQLAELDRLGCLYIQGFYYSEPMEAAQLDTHGWMVEGPALNHPNTA